MNGQFIHNGCCILDFYLLWTEQAIESKDTDRAYNYSRLLAHAILKLLEPQYNLFNESKSE